MFQTDRSPAADAVEVDIRDVDELYGLYMPFITNGGLFLNRLRLDDSQHDLGDAVVLWLRLSAVDEPQRLETRVVWMTPYNPARSTGGVGVQFMDNGQTQEQIERLLTGMLQSERPTQTL